MAVGDVFLFHVKLTQDKAILYEDVKFIADHSDNLNLTLEQGRLRRCSQGHVPQWTTITAHHP
jgi:hypothetical protein